MKKIILAVVLLIILPVCAMAADTLPVFVNALAYYQSNAASSGGNTPPHTLPTFNIINLSPFNITIGANNQSNIFAGNSGVNAFSQKAVPTIFLQGLNGKGIAGNAPAPNSVQIPLLNPANSWCSPAPAAGSVSSLAVPITINTGNSNFSLYFTLTSAQYLYSGSSSSPVPAPLLSSSSINSSYNKPAYGYSSTALVGTAGAANTVQFVGLETANKAWSVATGLSAFFYFSNSTGSVIAVPLDLSQAGLVCPKIAAENGNYLDLAVIVQAGDYTQINLIFVALNTQDDWMLGPNYNTNRPGTN